MTMFVENIIRAANARSSPVIAAWESGECAVRTDSGKQRKPKETLKRSVLRFAPDFGF